MNKQREAAHGPYGRDGSKCPDQGVQILRQLTEDGMWVGWLHCSKRSFLLVARIPINKLGIRRQQQILMVALQVGEKFPDRFTKHTDTP
ncbi:hypothetical protein CSA57_00325 [candidate division KSB3 bacterium]|nr:MAG: hypothetical protein CSA57_00325 [candidate division KSB3 bacterium]